MYITIINILYMFVSFCSTIFKVSKILRNTYVHITMKSHLSEYVTGQNRQTIRIQVH